MSHTFCRRLAFSFAVALLSALVVMPAQAQAPSTDPIVGTWHLDVAKSTLVPPIPKSRYRTIDVTHDQMIHISYGTVDDKGRTSFGWYDVKLDGTTGYEYMRSTGAVPYAELSVTRPQPRTIAVIAKRNGKLSSEVTFTVSADGQTLTEDMTSHTDTGKTRNVRIYNKQP